MISSDDERKPWLTALEARFTQAEPNLSASRQGLLRKILDHAEETYFLSSRALAKRYDLDPTTIVRTVQALGYKRYGEFAADLRSHFVTRITPYAVMKSAVRDKRSVASHIEHTLEIDVQNLNALRSQLDVKQVVEIAKRIDRARRIMVVGIDFAASLSNLLAYGLVSVGYDAEAPAGSAGNLQQKILLLGPKDLLIAISFGRCLQDTVDSVIRAHGNGVPTVGFTDSEKSPIARFSDVSWVTSIASPSFHGSYVAVVSAINALLVACSQLHPQRSLSALRRKEQEFRSRWYTPTPAKSGTRTSGNEE
ncbi:MAG TPA: MurR/RpiR family transcriptional regulator [Candidatus Sulfotelmatobacter sp.]|nr:MurR/RpiR family transcriptional regulator [Candidatus Sulfotelmatobacter sp.]